MNFLPTQKYGCEMLVKQLILSTEAGSGAQPPEATAVLLSDKAPGRLIPQIQTLNLQNDL